VPQLPYIDPSTPYIDPSTPYIGPRIGVKVSDLQSFSAPKTLDKTIKTIKTPGGWFFAIFLIQNWSFEFCWAWLRQRSLFDRGVYGSWRAADGGFEPLVMR